MSPNPPQPPRPDDVARVDRLLDHFNDLEQQFEQVRDGLTRSHRLATLGTIATIIAHEYNNILTPVISYAQLALANPDDHELMHKAIEKALHGADRASRISSSLLGFARDEDEPAVARLPEVVHETLACLGREPRRDGIDLHLELPEINLAISPLNLQQVLLNLILNARKVMRKRGGRLTIRGHSLPDGRTARVEVVDTGPGIPPDLIDSLFEPFVTHEPAHHADDQPDPAFDNEQHKGTGLGLCICRDLVTKAGGSITVDSTPGQGASFHITLPLATAAATSSTDPLAARRAAG